MATAGGADGIQGEPEGGGKGVFTATFKGRPVAALIPLWLAGVILFSSRGVATAR